MKHNLATRPFFHFYFYSWNFSSLSFSSSMIDSYFLFSPKAPVLSSSSLPPPVSLPPSSLCFGCSESLSFLNLSRSAAFSVSLSLSISGPARVSADPRTLPGADWWQRPARMLKSPGVGALRVIPRVPRSLQHAGLWTVYSNMLCPSSVLTTGPGSSPYGDHSLWMLRAQTVILARSPSPLKLPDTRTEPGRAPSCPCTHPPPPAKQPTSQGSRGHVPPAWSLAQHPFPTALHSSTLSFSHFLSPVGPSNWDRRK